MLLNTEVYISIDGEIFSKIDLAKSESINMKYVLKDTTDLSKIYSPFSLSFTFPGTLNNQRIFGFVGNTKVYKTKTDNVFACKIYSNGLLFQTGKLKITEVREDNGFVKSFTANFTTTMLSLTTRMGEDTINTLPTNTVEVSWLPNDVYDSVQSIKIAPNPIPGLVSKYYVPLISRNRIFQRRLADDVVYLDNVAYVAGSDPTSTKTLKVSELRPAIQGRTIIDLIKAKYNLDVTMPLEDTSEYNDWYIYCNAENDSANTQTTIDIVNDLFLYIVSLKNDPGGDGLPDNPRYNTTVNLPNNTFTVTIDDAFYPDRWGGDFQLNVVLNGVIVLDGSDSSDFLIVVKRTDNSILVSDTFTSVGNTLTAEINLSDSMFQSGTLSFTIEIAPKQISYWSNMDVFTIQQYYHSYTFAGFNSVERKKWKYLSSSNNNASTSGAGTIDLFKTLPVIKCTDFLNSFFKTFNISVFDASPNDDRLFWLTPKDLLVTNKEYSKKSNPTPDYTPYIVSKEVNKKIAADYNYYNFKHKTSKYKSNADFLLGNGLEFGQTTWPTVKPIENPNEFKVETGFSILEALPIAGMSDEFTSYGFTNDTPTILDTGEKRYTPNSEDLTIFFAGGSRSLKTFRSFGGSLQETNGKKIGFQKTDSSGSFVTAALTSYIKTTPVHPNGFSFGFSLIQESVLRSLYYDFYKTQTERLLSPNTLQHSFKLQLPASELVLNFATTGAGGANVPDGFRLQNEIVLQEQRFSVIDAQIDITTGKADFNLLNFI